MQFDDAPFEDGAVDGDDSISMLDYLSIMDY